jgi:hypothetical protein
MSKPDVVSREAMANILLDMSQRVRAGDSWEGSVEYHYWDEEHGAGQGEYSVKAAYRIGNLEGQGGMRVIEARDRGASMSGDPYLIKRVVRIVRLYNPNHGDRRLCVCGHEYHRHFDGYEEENMQDVGCKYCPCSDFKEASHE